MKKLDDNDAYERRDILVFPMENCPQLLCKLALEVFKVNISPVYIFVGYSLINKGPKNQHDGRPEIIVNFFVEMSSWKFWMHIVNYSL